MIPYAFLAFFILAWACEHGRVIRLKKLCRRCIDDLKRFDSKESAGAESVPSPCKRCSVDDNLPELHMRILTI